MQMKNDLSRVYGLLVDPAESIHTTEEQNRARLLAAVSLVFIVLYALMTIIFVDRQNPAFIGMLITVVLTSGIYGLSRTIRYRIGIAALPIVLLLAMAAILALHPAPEVMMVMIVPVLIAGLFWTPLQLTLLTVTSLLAAVVLIGPGADGYAIAVRSIFLIGLAAIEVIASVIWRRTQHQLTQRTLELEASENRFWAIIDNSPDAYFLLRSVRDSQQRIIDFELTAANEVGAKQLESTVEELLGTQLRQRHERWVIELFECFTSIVETRQPTTLEIRSNLMYGHMHHWYSISGVPVDDGVAVISRDITEHKLTHETLRESEARFRNIADSAPVLMWVAAEDKRITYFNRSWLTFTGRSMEEEVDYGWADGVHPEDREFCINTYEQSFDAHRPYQMTYRLRRYDGEYRWLLENGIPRFADDGMFLGYVGSALDITEQKAQEIALRESQAWLEATMKSLPFDFWAMDVSGCYVLQNDHSIEVWGNNVGKRPEELDALSDVLVEWEEINARAFAGEESRVEMIYHGEGGPFYHYNVAVPVRDGERIIGIAGVDIDITDTKQLEAKLRALLQAIPDFMARMQRDGTYLEALHGGDFTDLMFSDRLVGKTVYDVLTQELAAMRLELIQKALETGQLQTYEYTLETFDSNPRQLESRITASGPDEVLVMVRDVTARKEADARALDLVLERERLELLRRFLGDRTHDLMTPLTILKTSLYLMNKTDSAQRRAEHLDKFGTQIDNLEAMIRNMLMILRLDKPIEDEFEFALQDLNGLVAQVVADHQPVAISRQQILHYDAQTNLPLVMFDREKLERALANIIDNGLKYTRDGGRVIVSTELVDGEVCIKVCDNGRGISTDDLPHIFNRFFRSEDSQTTIGGSGLGLAIVDKIVRAHGGRIEVDSQENMGTTFFIYLPPGRERAEYAI